jgi:signal transduction protein with GAF and PtsI domain
VDGKNRPRVPLDLGHAGQVVQHQRPLLLANADEATDFRQILKTARMGSALLAPMFWQG